MFGPLALLMLWGCTYVHLVRRASGFALGPTGRWIHRRRRLRSCPPWRCSRAVDHIPPPANGNREGSYKGGGNCTLHKHSGFSGILLVFRSLMPAVPSPAALNINVPTLVGACIAPFCQNEEPSEEPVSRLIHQRQHHRTALFRHTSGRQLGHEPKRAQCQTQLQWHGAQPQSQEHFTFGLFLHQHSVLPVHGQC